MSFLKVLGIGSMVLLFSFSTANADAADDLLRALGGLPGFDLPASTIATPTQPPQATTTIVASTTLAAPVMTEAERNSQIDSLRAFVVTLTQQLQEILAKKVADTNAAAAAKAKAIEDARFKPENCMPIARTLARGSSGADVRCLQAVLVADKLLEEKNATGYFGELTERALKQFQMEVGLIAATGSVGPNTRIEVNMFFSLLAKMATQGNTSASETLGSAMISFGPQLPVGVQPEDFVLLAKEKVDYALRIISDEPGAFVYSIDWADGTRETGVIRSGNFKTIPHTYTAGVYEVRAEAHNDKSAGDGTFTIGINPAGGGGELLDITSPQAAFKFDVVTLMPVTLHAKDPRANGSARLYLQDSPTAKFATGAFLGEMPLSDEDATSKFPLTEFKAGTYWLQAIGTRFQSCDSDVCKEFLPNDTVGPIEITDQTNFAASREIPADVGSSTATTSLTSH